MPGAREKCAMEKRVSANARWERLEPFRYALCSANEFPAATIPAKAGALRKATRRRLGRT